MMGPFGGKIVAITGGGGAIASDIAHVLARGGARVAVGHILS